MTVAELANQMALKNTDLIGKMMSLGVMATVNQSLDQDTAIQAKDIVVSLVEMLDDATQIVDFFNKWDEQKRVKREIKRVVIKHFDESAVKPVTERFMDLAKVKFN